MFHIWNVNSKIQILNLTCTKKSVIERNKNFIYLYTRTLIPDLASAPRIEIVGISRFCKSYLRMLWQEENISSYPKVSEKRRTFIVLYLVISFFSLTSIHFNILNLLLVFSIKVESICYIWPYPNQILHKWLWIRFKIPIRLDIWLNYNIQVGVNLILSIDFTRLS